MIKKLNPTPFKAETILEAIIAISMLLLIIGPAGAMYVSSIQTVGGNRTDVVAAALAEEGLEIVRNMRDTNFMKFSPKAETCWNTRPADTNFTPMLDNCDKAQNKIGDETKLDPILFKLMFNPDTLEWTLDSGVTPPPKSLDDYRLRLDNPTQSDPECPTNAPACHTHTGLYFLPPPGLPGHSPRGSESLFNREVTVEYIDADSDSVPDPVMRITSIVTYESGTKTRSVKRILILSNKQL